MGETRYAAVTGDLVASRKASGAERAEVQRETLLIIEKLNQDLGQDLARPAVLTAGDEVQALFRVPSRAVAFVQVIKDHLYGSSAPNQDIVFGVGWGVLSTGLLPEAASVEQLDGTCFHHARETLTAAKKQKIWVVFQGFGADNDRTLTSLFELMGAIRAGWTTTQSGYTVAFRKLEEDLKKEQGVARRIDVARKVGRSPSVVTESLQLSHYDAIRNGEETARRILQQFDPTGTGTES